MRRSSLVNETNEGVVKLPCSLATAGRLLNGCYGKWGKGGRILISTLVPS
jgi:hypothetical protein